ncbi:hypothetical protein [Lewinella sp. 4G2]|uniref:hypothetical protein n=1 Tax=Lewinella sp. 4G2 TaxID=1803372 RepID=UPI0007B4CB8A|nr:hypothetical protein [Lewinella sp. 4G2]OAV44345.1 hypothetical protein A3850_007485 [Lewinella sp. 4G2]
MKTLSHLVTLLILLTACNSPSSEAPAPPLIKATSTSEFTFDLGMTGAKLGPDDNYHAICEGCEASPAPTPIAGFNAIKVTTDQEFSDYLLNLEDTYGQTFDFTKAKYLTLHLLVPKGSYVRAMKLNFRDAEGNFGGIGEVANNFPDQWGEWQTIVIDLEKQLQDFKLWHGESSPLSAVAELSLNPYNANQEGPQAYYVSRIQLSDAKPEGGVAMPLLSKPSIPNQSYTFTFDDPAELDPLMAYRVFEASNQAFAKGIGGNETNAIRMRGRPELNNIAFLPIVQQMNGQPVDFTKVKELFFDYYLEPGGDDFDGATLYLTSEHWNDILIDPRAYTDFVAGEWRTVRLPIKDVNLSVAKGDGDFLDAVYEWRLNLNFREDEKDITMWLDNVGWK